MVRKKIKIEKRPSKKKDDTHLMKKSIMKNIVIKA
jgi:hypothetical protein